MHCATVALVVLVAATAQVVSGYSGIRVSGTSIVDGKGYNLVMRGINHAHSWFKDDADKAIPAIAATRANVIRLVLSNGVQYTKDDEESVKHLIDLCRENKLIAILEVHDATGSDEEWRLERAADYWVSLASILQGTEDYVIVNIANEWIGSSGKAVEWAAGYKSVIPRIRAAGINNMLIVDSAGWGQDAACIAEQGRSIFDADEQKNTIFSIHMYEVAGADEATIQRNIENSLAIGVPVIVGEFSDAQNGLPVDYKSIMKYCTDHGIGWLVWSWYGNNPDTANMDLATGPAGELTTLGQEIIGGVYGVTNQAWGISTWW